MRILKILIGAAALMFITVLSYRNGLHELLGIVGVHAQDSVLSATNGILAGVSGVMALVITGLNTLMWVLFKLIEMLLSPNLIFEVKDGIDGPLLQMLHTIWILSRDLMNMVFAFLLIAGAVYTIMKGKGDVIKEFLPKFIFAVVLVNFSWFGARALFDVSQVLTYTAFQIPNLLGPAAKCEFPVKKNGVTTKEKCKIVVDMKFLDNAWTLADDLRANPDPSWDCTLMLVCIKKLNYDDPAANVTPQSLVINGLIINHARLLTLLDVVNSAITPVANERSVIRDTILVLMKILLILLIHIGLFFPMLAIAAALFLRIPLLWITTAFMPFALLSYAASDKIPHLDLAKKIWTNFLSAVFLPAMVAVPLSLGFLLINAGINTPVPAGFATDFPLLSQVTDFWQLLWMFIAFLVLWIGVFTALKQNEITGRFSEGIKGMGEAAGKFAVSAPLAIPWLPAPGGKPGETVSPLKMFQTYNPKSMLSDLDATGDLKKTFANRASVMRGSNPLAIEEAGKKLKADTTVQNNIHSHIEIINNTGSSEDALKKAFNDAVTAIKNSHPDYGTTFNDQDFKELLKKASNVNHPQLEKAYNAAHPAPPSPTSAT